MAKKSITKCIQSLLLAFLILAGFHQWKPQAEPLKQLLVVSDDLTHGHIEKKNNVHGFTKDKELLISDIAILQTLLNMFTLLAFFNWLFDSMSACLPACHIRPNKISPCP